MLDIDTIEFWAERAMRQPVIYDKAVNGEPVCTRCGSEGVSWYRGATDECLCLTCANPSKPHVKLIKAYDIGHYDRINQVAHQRRRARLKSLPSELSTDDWELCLKHFSNACAYCGDDEKQTFHQDHYIPVARGGGYVRANIVPACRTCNSKKSGAIPEEWLVKRFGAKSEGIQKRIEFYFLNCL